MASPKTIPGNAFIELCALNARKSFRPPNYRLVWNARTKRFERKSL